MLSAPGEVTFKVDPPLILVMKPGDIPKHSKEQLKLRDDTVIKGEFLPSPIIMGVDAIDFRHTAMRAEAEGIDPMKTIEQSWILTHTDSHGGNDLKRAWDCHMAWLKYQTERLEKNQPPFSPMYSAQFRSSRTFLQKQIPSNHRNRNTAASQALHLRSSERQWQHVAQWQAHRCTHHV